MRRSLLLILLLLPAAASAQEKNRPEVLKHKLEDKLRSPWLSSPRWITDYDEALRQGAERKRALFAYFTRSYAY